MFIWFSPTLSIGESRIRLEHMQMKSRQLASWPVSVSLALKFYFFSQSFPDIRAKLKCLGKEPLTLQAKVLVMAFKMYHGRDEKQSENKNNWC